jgi:hypothetical protein
LKISSDISEGYTFSDGNQQQCLGSQQYDWEVKDL